MLDLYKALLDGQKTRIEMNIFQTSTAFYPSMGGAQLHWFTIGKMLAERGHTGDGVAG